MGLPQVHAGQKSQTKFLLGFELLIYRPVLMQTTVLSRCTTGLLSNDPLVFVLCSETKNPVTLIAHRIKTEFFTDEVLVTLCRHLVLHYFVLTHDDLVCWETDPESFSRWRYVQCCHSKKIEN